MQYRFKTVISITESLLSQFGSMKQPNAYNNNNDYAAMILQMTDPNFTQPAIIRFEKMLSIWNGIKNKKIEDFDHYRDYFRKCKNWFDQRKMKILAETLWIPLIRIMKIVCLYLYCTQHIL